MPVVSAGDLTALRSEFQIAAVRISWLIPPVLWQARINDGSIVKGETSIAFNSGTGSYFSMVEALQEVWVGTASGRNDVGRLRVKSISSGDGGVTGTLVVGGHSHPLQDTLYLTFLHDYPIKPKFSYIDPGSETWYMDDDVIYSDQHSNPPPVVIAGPHRAGFLISGSVVFNVDASASHTMASGATKTSYGLTVASTAGAPAVNFSAVTGLGDITFTATGYYWAKYSVTDSNQKTQISYRCYMIHETDLSDPSYPFIDCESVQLEADWENGGWTASVKAEDNMALADIPDHTLCVIWHTPWYEGSINHVTFLPDDNPAVFVGYVREDTETQQMAEGGGEADLTLSTAEGRLRQMFNFSTSLIVKKTSPGEWWEYEKWQTCGTIVHDLFLWRSTILEVCDVIGLRDDTLNRMFQGFDEGNVYDNANNFLYSEGIRKRVLCDQGGRIHIVEDQQLMIDADRGAITTAMPLIQTEAIADYGQAFVVQRKQEYSAPFITANGIYWDGNTWGDEDRPESNGEYCSIAPGGKPLWQGADPQDFPKQTVSSQDHLNQICGRYEAKVNNQYPEIVVEFHGQYNTVLDIAYGEEYTISLQASETPREVVWSNKPLYCKHVQATYNSEIGHWEVNASFEPENITTDGVYTECPSYPELGGQIPDPNPAENAGALMTGASINFKGASGGLWVERVAQDVKDVIEDPYWRTKTGSDSPDNAITIRAGVGFIKRSTDGFKTIDVDITPSNNPPNDAGDSPAPTATGVTYMMSEGAYPIQDRFVFLARWQNSSSEWRSWICITNDNGSNYTWKFLGEVPTGCEEYGTKSSAFSTGSWTISHSEWHLGNPILEVATDKYVIVYEDVSENNTYVRCFSLSGDVATWGAAVDINTPPTLEGGQLFYIDTDKFGVIYNTDSGAGEIGRPAIKIGTLAGETISLGSIQNITNNYESVQLDGIYEVGIGLSAVCPTTARIVVTKFGKIMVTSGDNCVESADYGWFALWGDISGSTITWEEWTDCGAVALETVGKWRTVSGGLVLNHWDTSVAVQVGSYGLFAYSEGSMGGDLNVFSVSGTEDSATAETMITTNVEKGEFCLLALTSTKAIIIWQEYNGSEYELYGAVITVSGAAPSSGGANLLWTSSGGSQWAGDIFGAVITSTKAVLSHTLYGGDCQTNLILDIDTDTITVDDICNSMNEWSGPVYGQTSTKYMLMGWDADASNDGVIWAGLTASDVAACSGGAEDSYAMGLSLAKTTGNTAWVTASNNTIIQLIEVGLGAMIIANRFELGSATIAQVIAQTYLAYPFVPFGYDDAVYVYGRMNNPQSLGDPAHIIRTEDGGSSFGLIEAGWEADHCGSLAVHLTNQMFAIRNAADRSKLYVDDADNILVLKMTLPFFAQVAPHGMLLDYYTMDVYACAWTPDVWMVIQISSPYLSATNLTFDHQHTSGGIESIIKL